MSSTQSSEQPETLKPRVKLKVEVINDKTKASKPQPPFDPFPLIYWLLFVLIVPLVAIWMANKPASQVSLPFLYRDVPAYHLITSNDIYMKLVDKSSVTADTVQEKVDLIGHYTLTPIRAGQALHQGQVGPVPEQSLFENTLAVGISADSATILGGGLHAGDIVSIATIPLAHTTSLPTIIFNAVLVLDVKSSGSQAVIILAIPLDRWPYYLVQTRNSTMVLARQVG